MVRFFLVAKQFAYMNIILQGMAHRELSGRTNLCYIYRSIGMSKVISIPVVHLGVWSPAGRVKASASMS